jgi:2'-5' RNA ligase
VADQKKLFVGVPVSLRTVDALAGAAETLARRAQQGGLALRWVAPARYHVTLKYLGSCRADAVPAVIDAVRRAAATVAPFKFTTARLGAFPSNAKATVVWAGVQDAPQLAALAAKVDAETSALGFARETRKFQAHVTMGRLREPGDVASVLLPLAEQVFSETRVEELLILETETKTDSSEYPVVATVALKGP